MNARTAASLLFTLMFVFAGTGSAQNGKQQHIAELAFQAEMNHDVGACPEAQTVTDRDVCLNDARVETYKNYKQFYAALRESLIQSSPNDSNALTLDVTELTFEKYRSSACDALVNVYDIGTIKHPGAAEPSSKTRCLITITRSRMRDLRDMYATNL